MVRYTYAFSTNYLSFATTENLKKYIKIKNELSQKEKNLMFSTK